MKCPPAAPDRINQSLPRPGIKLHYSSTRSTLVAILSVIYRNSCALSSRSALHDKKTKTNAKNARSSPGRSYLSSHCTNKTKYRLPFRNTISFLFSHCAKEQKTKSDTPVLPCNPPPASAWSMASRRPTSGDCRDAWVYSPMD